MSDYLNLPNRNSGRETMVIMIVVGTMPKHQLSAFPVVLTIALPP